MSEVERHIVIGAGPAGLTAAWYLAQDGRRVTVLEADPEYVGGLARSVEFEGHRFDIGPHRFYSKSDAIQATWRAMLPDEFVRVKRLTRIYYERKFYSYPIAIGETLRNLGLLRAGKIGASYLRARAFPRRPVQSFEDWAVNAFGMDLYRRFFKTYTEKVWGMPCAEIDQNWAAQRIRGLSLFSTMRQAILGGKTGSKSLVSEFIYPRRGAGQLWETVRDKVLDQGRNECLLGHQVDRIHRDSRRILAVTTQHGITFRGSHFYATMPLRELVAALDPPAPERVRAAAASLRYRDFIVLNLIVDRSDLFPDQWIYVHDPDVRVARITNFSNWNTGVDSQCTALSVEYFCNRDEPTWQLTDAELVDLAVRELRSIGLIDAETQVRGQAVRVQNAYPVYDHGYQDRLSIIRDWLRAAMSNLFPAGRGGLHNYNSQDHAMMSGMLSVRNATEGADHDVWSINTDAEYAEEIDSPRIPEIEERLVPRRNLAAGG